MNKTYALPSFYTLVQAVILLLACFILLFGGVLAWAQTAAISTESKDLPEYPFLPQAQFIERTDLLVAVPYKNDFLSFEIRLPKGWTGDVREDVIEDGVIKQKLFQNAVRYQSPADAIGIRSLFEVSTQELTRPDTAEQWLLYRLFEQGYSIIGYKVIDPTRVEVVYAKVVDGVTYITRALGIINGRYALQIEYNLPQNYWAEQRALQDQVIDSFALLKRDTEKVGKLEEFRLLDVLSFQYPQGWGVKAPVIKTIDRMTCYAVNMSEDGEIEGHVVILAVSASVAKGIDEEISTLRDDIALSQKVVVEEAPIELSQDFAARPMITGMAAEVYKAAKVSQMDFTKMELWVGLSASEDYYYFIGLVTPSRKENFLAWSDNVNGFKNILETLSPKTDQTDEQVSPNAPPVMQP